MKELQILRAGGHLGNDAKPKQPTNNANKVQPMLHHLTEPEQVKVVKYEEDTEKLASETGRILPMLSGICSNCD